MEAAFIGGRRAGPLRWNATADGARCIPLRARYDLSITPIHDDSIGQLDALYGT
jgi:hypothetical protein